MGFTINQQYFEKTPTPTCYFMVVVQHHGARFLPIDNWWFLCYPRPVFYKEHQGILVYIFRDSFQKDSVKVNRSGWQWFGFFDHQRSPVEFVRHLENTVNHCNDTRFVLMCLYCTATDMLLLSDLRSTIYLVDLPFHQRRRPQNYLGMGTCSRI